MDNQKQPESTPIEQETHSETNEEDLLPESLDETVTKSTDWRNILMMGLVLTMLITLTLVVIYSQKEKNPNEKTVVEDEREDSFRTDLSEIYDTNDDYEAVNEPTDEEKAIIESRFYEDEDIKFAVPADWEIKQVKIFPYESTILIEKDLYQMRIVTDAYVTGGGWGEMFFGMCTPTGKTETSVTDKLARVNFSLSRNCVAGDTNAQERIIWGGSTFKNNSAAEFVHGVDIDEYKGLRDQGNNEMDENVTIISYRYNYGKENNRDENGVLQFEREIPSHDDPQIAEREEEMDEIVKTIVFK